MCDNNRYGSSLEHGRAHDADHRRWSRRDFMAQVGAGGVAAGFMLGGHSFQAYAQHPLQRILSAGNTERILVIVQLNGGNDGLNTIVPFRNDVYYQRRPGLAIAEADVLKINDDYGFHPAMTRLHGLWNDGKVGIINNVGYTDPNLSHFKSTDIWNSASDSSDVQSTGWLGRFLYQTLPDFETNPTEFPPAITIGNQATFALESPIGSIGLSFQRERNLDRLANGEAIYDTDNVPSSDFGDQLKYVRTVANNSYRYAGVVKEALQSATNQAEYGSRDLGLANVARMIKAGLPTRLYVVNLGGFDTHQNQAGKHAQLMGYLSDAMSGFYEDLKATGDSQRVMMMTFSEFGRRPYENGSLGTDHGTAAPLFVVGDNVKPQSFMGGDFDLVDLDRRDNLKHTTEFRSVYATMLHDWLGGKEDVVDATLGGTFNRIAVIDSSCRIDAPAGEVCTFLPVELTRFTTASDGADIVLSWTTASELNNAGFEVQQRVEEESDFRTVLFVEGHGTTSQVQNYQASLPDQAPGTYTFRLKQIDFDGKATYSAESALVHEATEAFTINKAYPSPFKNSTTVGITIAQPQRVRAVLYDALGRKVRTLVNQDMAAHRVHNIQVEAGNLPNGVYFIHVEGAYFKATERVMLLR